MIKPTKKPCNECPMRRVSAPGWLGAAEPEEIIDAMGGHGFGTPCNAMPCHLTVDYDDPNWREQLEGSKVRQCSGQAIYLANICKMPRPGETAVVGTENHKLVFGNRAEFLAHHNRGSKR